MANQKYTSHTSGSLLWSQMVTRPTVTVSTRPFQPITVLSSQISLNPLLSSSTTCPKNGQTMDIMNNKNHHIKSQTTKKSLTSSSSSTTIRTNNLQQNTTIQSSRDVPMYEGSHIHYSPVDNKPLCSYSVKLCKQRRINGYAFCIRHILEDKSSPFKQCLHVAKYNKLKCSNAIPANENRQFCNSHMQIAGMAPKRERKEKTFNYGSASGSTVSGSGSAASGTAVSGSVSGSSASGYGSSVVSRSVSSSSGGSSASRTSCSVSQSSSVSGTSVSAYESGSSGSLSVSKGFGSNINVNDKNHKSTQSMNTQQLLMTSEQILLNMNRVNSVVNNVMFNNNNDNNLKNHQNSVMKNNSSFHTSQQSSSSQPLSSVTFDAFVKKAFNNVTGNVSITTRDKSTNGGRNNKSISSHVTDNGININTKSKKMSVNNKEVTTKKSKRKVKKSNDKSSVIKYIFAKKFKNNKKKHDNDDLFNYNLWSESDDENDDDDDDVHNTEDDNDNFAFIDDTDDLFSLSLTRFTPRVHDIETNELKNELNTYKWLLKNLISMRQRDICNDIEKTRDYVKQLKLRNDNDLDMILKENGKRSSESIRKGICCYTSDDSVTCSHPSLPFARHCLTHILYNVDQLLFSRCTAKCHVTLTQCSQPTFDITHEEPLCQYHQKVHAQERDERSVSSPSVNDGKSITKKRKKTKPLALTRVNRRSKKRRKTNGYTCDVLLQPIDESIDTNESFNDTTNNVIESQSRDHVSDEMRHHMIASQTNVSSSTITTESIHTIPTQLLRLQNILPPSASPIVDATVMPPPLEPTEEALVASIVADLPNDADFSDVLKIPDDAFNDFFVDHQNGEGPSTEETEALEQALALVNKDVQNLVAAAGINGQPNDIMVNGQSGALQEILGMTSNWLGSLTCEQRQQLNGLIDGAIASNSLSPILKNACDAFPSVSSPIVGSSSPMKNSISNLNISNSSFVTPQFGSPYPLLNIATQLPMATANNGQCHDHIQTIPNATTHATIMSNTMPILMNGISSNQR